MSDWIIGTVNSNPPNLLAERWIFVSIAQQSSSHSWSLAYSRSPQHHRSPAELPTEERNDQPRPRISAFAAQHHTNLNINKIPPPETPPSCTHRAIMAGRFVRASKYRQQCSSPDERHEIRLTAGQDMFLGSRRGRNLAMTTCTLVATRGIPIW
jgi:hypothetical protein